MELKWIRENKSVELVFRDGTGLLALRLLFLFGIMPQFTHIDDGRGPSQNKIVERLRQINFFLLQPVVEKKEDGFQRTRYSLSTLPNGEPEMALLSSWRLMTHAKRVFVEP